jgi:hypothetical protein
LTERVLVGIDKVLAYLTGDDYLHEVPEDLALRVGGILSRTIVWDAGLRSDLDREGKLPKGTVARTRPWNKILYSTVHVEESRLENYGK